MSNPKKTDSILVRVDVDLKERSKMILQREKLTHSKAIRLFLEHISINGIPEWLIQDK